MRLILGKNLFKRASFSLRNGFLNVDKIARVSSREMTTWTKKFSKASHAGTFDLGVAGTLITNLKRSTRHVKSQATPRQVSTRNLSSRGLQCLKKYFFSFAKFKSLSVSPYHFKEPSAAQSVCTPKPA